VKKRDKQNNHLTILPSHHLILSHYLSHNLPCHLIIYHLTIYHSQREDFHQISISESSTKILIWNGLEAVLLIGEIEMMVDEMVVDKKVDIKMMDNDNMVE